MEKQPSKQSTCSVLDIKLNDVKDRERMREKKENDKERQVEKEVINITNETTVENSEVSNVDMIRKEKCLEEQNKQAMAGDPREVTTENNM